MTMLLPFPERVLTCKRVWDDWGPVLQIWHDHDSEWSFLCGADHTQDIEDICLAVPIVELHARDEALLSFATSLPIHHMAWRATTGAPWTIEDRSDEAYDETLSEIEEKITQHGWTVVTIPAEERAGMPQFAYTVGLQTRFNHPELITVGLPANVASNLLQLCVGRISAGDRFGDNQIRSDLLNNNLRCLIRCVGKANLQLLGFARRHTRGQLEALQCIWPDKAGRLPGEPDYMKSDSQLLLGNVPFAVER